MIWWQAGSSIQDGKYEIGDILGGGGFGITYRGTDLSAGKEVAIKVLNPLIQSKPNFDVYQDKFVKEAFCLAKCRHPHVVEVIDVCKESKLWCMIMEYIPGLNLQEYIQERGVLEENEALHYIRQIGDALSFVHSQGFLHRDVKPQNIMLRDPSLSTSQEAVLIDFGLAREFTLGKTQTHTESLSEGYTPIEQYNKRDKRGEYTDVYSLAATLYKLLTNESIPLAFVRKLNDNDSLIAPIDYNSNISLVVNDAILRGMELFPENRPQSIEEWLNLLPGKTQDTVFKKASESTSLDSIFIESASSDVNDEVEAENVYDEAKVTSDLELIAVQETPKLESYIFLSWLGYRNETLKTFDFSTTILDLNGTVHKQGGQAEFYIQKLEGGVEIYMVSVLAGQFIMGSSQEEFGQDPNEKPQHPVSISPFFLSRSPVTQEQWEAVMGWKPSRFKFQGKNRPAECISWDDANEFCKVLSEKTGKSYRLPSEAEWEYACRAGMTTPFSCGQTIQSWLANYHGKFPYKGEQPGRNRAATTPIRKFQPNAFGLYDMHGNVWEWCADSWHDNYIDAPTDNSPWLCSEQETSLKVLRGGSWDDSASDCRSAKRYCSDRIKRSNRFGFRVARSIDLSFLQT